MTKTTDQKRTTAYSRAALKRKMEETVGDSRVKYTIEDQRGGDDLDVFIPNPFFYDRETKAAFKEVERLEEIGDDEDEWPLDDDGLPKKPTTIDEDGDEVEFDAEIERARVMLGEQWDEYVAAGGTVQEITHLSIIIGREASSKLSDGTPTRR